MPLNPATVRRFRNQYGTPSSVKPLAVRLATVTNVAAGASVDGQAQVTVNLNGASVIAPWLNTAPANGALVAVLLVFGSPLILGTVRGLPNI